MKRQNSPHILRALTALILTVILFSSTVTTTLAAVTDYIGTGTVTFSVKKGMPIYLNAYQAKSWFTNDNCVARIYFATDSSGANSTSVDVTTLSSDDKQYVGYAPADGYNYVKVSRYNGTDNNTSDWHKITGIETNTVNFADSAYTELGRSWSNTSSTNSGYGNIYFDNTVTNWTITSSDKLYFVIGTADNISMLEMSKVDNTSQLYYRASGSWGGYDLFGFALSSSTYTKIADLKTGAQAYTTLYGFYNLANGSDSSNNDKSFICYGLNSGDCVAMHTLWVDDNGLSTDPVWHTNEYLNRGQKLTISGRGSAKISGYKATVKGTAGVTAEYAVVGSNENTTKYFARSSNVTISDIEPNSGYTLTALTVDGTDILDAYNTNGTYTYIVPGGDESDCSDIAINVTFTKTSVTDVFLLGLWDDKVGTAWTADSTNNPDRLMNYSASLTQGATTFTNVYYLDMTLPGKSRKYDKASNNGFKIYDTDLDSPWLGNTGNYQPLNSGSRWGLSNTDNCEFTTISLDTNATYRFIYEPSTTSVYIYYPQIVTYNMNYTGGTTQQLAVTYGNTAKQLTPTRDGYSFGGWYTDVACTSAYDFTTSVTSVKTLYAKWDENKANIHIEKSVNGAASTVTEKSLDFSGVTSLTVNKPSDESGYNFKGWVLSGEMSSHIRLYSDANCSTAYVAGTAADTVYVKTDGSKGIMENNAVLTAVYLTSNAVAVNDGDTSQKSTAETYFTSISGKTSNPQAFDYGSAITVSFDDLPAGFGIETVTFAKGKAPDSYINYGHYIAFDMPDHDVTVTDMTVTPFTCRITVKNASTVDIDGLSSSGYYSTGADVHTITIKGSDDYYGTSVLNNLTVKYIGGTAVTVDKDHLDATTTFDGSTLTVKFEDNTVTITGNIGGNVVVTPECSTQYNVNITSKVMSDVGSKYITYNKKSTTADGEVESVVVADLKAYVHLDDISNIQSADAAAEADLAWENGALVSREQNGTTYYLIAADEDGDYIGKFDKNSKMLLVTDNRNTKYTFVGWFPGSSTGPSLNEPLVSPATEIYEYTLTESSFLYGVITRDIFIGGESPSGNNGLGASWSNAAKMTYDEENKVYYYETNSLWSSDNGANDYSFKIFDQAATGNTNASGTSNQAVWYNAAKTITYNQEYGIRLSGHTSTGTNEKATFQLYHTDADYTNIKDDKVRIYYKPSSQEVYVIPVYKENYHEVYLSNGRIDGMSTLGLTLNTPESTFTTPSATGSGTTIVSGTYQTENYCYYRFNDACDLEFKTTVSGTNASDVMVAGFVVYNLDTGEATSVTPTVSNNVYSGKITVSANTFICPVYELTDNYLSSHNNIKAYEVFVNAADADSNIWGDLVSMYIFGGSGDERSYNAKWPGQLMLPSGKNFSGMIYKKSNEALSGVVFENYNSDSTFFGKFGKRFNYPDWAQTYDYLEPITLMGREGDNLLSFSLKQNNDGYRGEYYNSRNDKKQGPYYLDVYNKENNETKPGVIYDYYDEGLGEHQTLFDNYTFEYLTDKDGKNRLNLYGESVGSASAGYYVICVGDVDYLNNTTQNGKTYDPATNYNGEYSVEWYVYDANGMFLLHTLSDSLYGTANDSENSYIVDKLLASGLISNPTTLKEKSVKISYEAPNTRSDATRFSGQWYANSTNEKVTVFAGVGMMTDSGDAIVPENPQSNASYGSATISFDSAAVEAVKGTVSGLNWGSLKLSDASKGYTTLTATWPDTSSFKGWYSYNETTDSYTKVSDGTIDASARTSTYSPRFGTESRYFAMFSAQATYYFTYPGRSGSTITYSVKADIGASTEEMNKGGILSADTTGTVKGESMTREDEIKGVIVGLKDVLKVFNHDLSFSVDKSKWDFSSPYEVTVEGTSSEAQYNLTVYTYNEAGTALELAGTISGTFNTIIDLTDSEIGGAGNSLADHHPTSDGKYFVGWQKYDGTNFSGEILSTHANFGYSLTEDLTIAPVFSDTKPSDIASWKASVDKNVITQELTNASTGVIYNDSIIRIRNTSDTATQFSGECGIVILAQTGNGADNTQKQNFTSLQDAKLLDYLTALKNLSSGKTSARMNSTTYGEAYAFYVAIDGSQLSRLNRVDIYQQLDYLMFNEGNYKVAAYYKDSDGNYQISTNVVSGTYLPHTYSINNQ